VTEPERLEQALATVAARNRELDLLRSIATTLLEFESSDQLFEEVARVAKDLVRADAGAVMIAAGEGEFVRIAAGDGLLRAAAGRLLPAEGSLAGWVVRQDVPLRVDDMPADPRNHPIEEFQAQLRAAVVVPLRSKGRAIGTITACKRTEPFADDDIHLLQALSEQVTVGLDRAALLEEARLNELELERKHRELFAASRLKDRFLASMSHELRTPLNAIIGFSDLLLAENAVDEGHRDWVESIARNGRHLLSLITDILDLSKLEAGRMTSRLARVDLRAVIGAAVADTESLRAVKKQRCLVEIGPASLEVLADGQQVRQVLFNLLSNASKFTDPDGTISVSALATRVPLPVGPGPEAGVEVRDAVWIAVEDSGKGIKEDDLPKLFQPFGQLDDSNARPHPGTGLGLALSKQLVELHGGTIGVESMAGQGSTFWFTLPVAGPPSAR
jgi:signal transduction histidine kinase